VRNDRFDLAVLGWNVGEIDFRVEVIETEVCLFDSEVNELVPSVFNLIGSLSICADKIHLLFELCANVVDATEFGQVDFGYDNNERYLSPRYLVNRHNNIVKSGGDFFDFRGERLPVNEKKHLEEGFMTTAILYDH
jgi:hypothetical protein